MRFYSGLSSLLEGILIAIDALRANKVRAALTILGIAIGVFVVVVMSSAIHGINAGVAQEFEQAGPTTFFVNRFPISLEACSDADDTSCKWRNNPPLRLAEAAAIGRLPSVKGITIATGASASVKYFDRSLTLQVASLTANWPEVNGGDIVQGRNFTAAEETSAARVVVINEVLAERLFGESDPLGKVITLNRNPFEVIGLYKEAGGFLGTPRPRAAVPITTGRRYLNAWLDGLEFTVRPRAGYDRDEAIDEVTAVIRGARGMHPAQDNNFAIITQDKLFETWGKMTSVFFLVMFALSAVGLIVGGVGVVAIMMISVTERTREIGVRKALGATRRVILWQFLVEAATLTAVGAVCGLLAGWFVALLVRSATPIQASIPPLAIVAALAASCLTGILFGIVPASRAARLDPIVALRYE
ncbi:MAG: Macrolide export ATP-binding/permease protein MacB [Gemmatimonadaceae bacterium]|nr:Macrolide export ATP-binding/permease protein MacB [Gemmatimonadaceae bacterium]